jgi:hypothetical protein
VATTPETTRTAASSRARLARQLAAFVPVIAVFAAVAAPPSSAHAAPCPKATSASTDLLVTSGVDDGRTTLTRRGRPKRGEVFGQEAAGGALVDGLLRRDSFEQPFVRTSPTKTGRKRLTLCTEDGRQASLPALSRGQVLAGVSVNGRYIAWRTTRNSRGTLNVGRVVRGRPHAIRATPTAPTLKGAAIDGRIIVTSSGDVAWALFRARGADDLRDVWVWPRGKAVKSIRRPKKTSQPSVVQFLDDQHLVLDDNIEPFRYRPSSPGRCPRLDATSWKNVGSWQTASTGGASGVGDEGAGWTFTVVCDPVSGNYRRIVLSSEDTVPGGGTNTSITRLAKAGPWLLIERRILERYLGSGTYSATTEIQNTDTNTSETVPGGIGGDGIPAASISPGSPPDATVPTGATLRQGALAWATPIATPGSSPARFTVTLADVAGRRDVGTATTSPAFSESTLKWSDGPTPASAAVNPAPNWDLGIAAP